jgi:GntR family transcriptional regulator, arabinose operon transcriptional repressor
MKTQVISDREDSQPKHERLRDYLMSELERGRFKAGDALPTEFELAETTQTSRSTVRQALASLERQGLIRRVRGRGTFIHEDAKRRLRSNSGLFALIIPETRGGFYPSLQRGFHEAAAALHHQVIVVDTGNDAFRQADMILKLIDSSVAGVAIVPTTISETPAHHLRPLQARNIPVVFCHRRVEGIDAPFVTYPHLDVGRMAGKKLVSLGHRRVAFFGAHRSGLGPVYEQGLREGLATGGAELPEEFVCYGATGKMDAQHEKFATEELKKMLSRKDRPTAVQCGFDSEAELVYLVLSRLGVRVPEDVSLMGFGGTWRDGAICRRLVSVALDEEELGRRAVSFLNGMARRQRPIHDRTEVVMPLTLTDGETLGPAPKSPKPIKGL